MGYWKGVSLSRRGFCLFNLEEKKLLFALGYSLFRQLPTMSNFLGNGRFYVLLAIFVVGLSTCAQASSGDGANFANSQAAEAQKEIDKLLSEDKDIASMRQLGLPTDKPSSHIPQGMEEQLEAVKTEAAKIIDRGELLQSMTTRTGCPSQLFNKEVKTRGNCSTKAVQPPLFANEGDKLKQGEEHQLFVFVSFSMPEASLKSLAKDATKYNAVLVMRGLFEDSFVKTANKLKDLGIGVDINPELFEEHQITAVPTFVALQSGKPTWRLKGNVTLGFVSKKVNGQIVGQLQDKGRQS
jgi:hypothetical protein